MLKVFEGSLDRWEGDAVLCLLRKEDCGGKAFEALPWADAVRELIRRRDFEPGKKGTLLRVPLLTGPIKNLYLASLGRKEDCSPSRVRDTLAWGLRTIGRQHNETALVLTSHLKDVLDPLALGEAEGLCGYAFEKYKTKEAEGQETQTEKSEQKSFSLTTVFAPDLGESETGRILAEAQAWTRDLANEPGCVINPPVLAARAQEMAEELGLACEVWDEVKLKEEGMGALLAVGSGSASAPRLIHLTYAPASKGGQGRAKKPGKKVVFVGKGITFDSGGLDIKPENYMKTMKGDKTGACNVLGILRGASALGLDLEVHGILAAAENMPSGSAFRPDDIVRARNGKTIEIDNTDAEGRLVLADALCLASELKPDAIIDMATLTGACAVALGNWRAGLFARDDALAEALLAASRRRGEPLWRMPAEDEHIEESLKSPFADMTNCGPRYGGAIFAALFLSRFVEKGIPWAHLDIAGVDFLDKEWGVYSKGASAFGVRTCLDYLMAL